MFAFLGLLGLCKAGELPSAVDIVESDRKIIGSPEFTPEMKTTWSHSPIQIDDDVLRIQGHPVMEAWERPYMLRLAQIATTLGGTVLECGHGMSISSTYIQLNATVPAKAHHIIEANVNVAARADKWAGEMMGKNGGGGIVVHRGYTWDVAPVLRDNSFDGILYDTYPLEPGKVGKHHLDFVADAARLLKVGGYFTFFMNEEEGLSQQEKKVLTEAGFVCTTEKVPTDTPDDCKYWRHKHLVAPTCVKIPAKGPAEL
jgi:guanidinoacetate N-methyltransferase